MHSETRTESFAAESADFEKAKAELRNVRRLSRCPCQPRRVPFSMIVVLAVVLAVILTACAVEMYGADVYEPVATLNTDSGDVTLANGEHRRMDGDTIVLATGERVRLIGINATELGRCYHDTATRELYDVVKNGVRLVRKGKDKYGRTLAYAYVDWRSPQAHWRLYRNSVNLFMVIFGYAKADHRFAHAYRKSYSKAEAWARTNQQGLWCECNCPQAPQTP